MSFLPAGTRSDDDADGLAAAAVAAVTQAIFVDDDGMAVAASTSAIAKPPSSSPFVMLSRTSSVTSACTSAAASSTLASAMGGGVGVGGGASSVGASSIAGPAALSSIAASSPRAVAPSGAEFVDAREHHDRPRGESDVGIRSASDDDDGVGFEVPIHLIASDDDYATAEYDGITDDEEDEDEDEATGRYDDCDDTGGRGEGTLLSCRALPHPWAPSPSLSASADPTAEEEPPDRIRRRRAADKSTKREAEDPAATAAGGEDPARRDGGDDASTASCSSASASIDYRPEGGGREVIVPALPAPAGNVRADPDADYGTDGSSDDGDGDGDGGFASAFRDPAAYRRWASSRRRVARRIDEALSSFPSSDDGMDVEAVAAAAAARARRAAAVGPSPRARSRSAAAAAAAAARVGDAGGFGGAAADSVLKALYPSDVAKKVAYENSRLMLQLKGEIFRGGGGGGCGARTTTAVSGSKGEGTGVSGGGRKCQVSPFFEVSVRRRRVRRAGSFGEAKQDDAAEDEQERKWGTIYRSYPISRTVRPSWEPLDVGSLDNGRPSSLRTDDDDGKGHGFPIRIDVYDAARRRRGHAGSGGGMGRLIGSAEARSDDLIAGRGRPHASSGDVAADGGGGEGNGGVFTLPLTRGRKHKGRVSIRTVRSAREDDDGDGPEGLRLQLEMHLPRVRMKVGNLIRRREGPGPSIQIRRRAPSPYFEVSLLEEAEKGRVTGNKEGKRKSGGGGGGDGHMLGDVSWDWCAIYRSYPVPRNLVPTWDPLEVILPPDAGRQADAPVRISLYDSAAGGGSHVERYLRSSEESDGGTAAKFAKNGAGAAGGRRSEPGFIGAFEARARDLTQGEERRFALIRDGQQRGWIYVLATERCDL